MGNLHDAPLSTWKNLRQLEQSVELVVESVEVGGHFNIRPEWCESSESKASISALSTQYSHVYRLVSDVVDNVTRTRSAVGARAIFMLAGISK